ncbi:MAG: hypothetical protein KKH28_13260 [Elusimicrobia bacterium]|nr:hypothetical protein [Elusimicrobiota bacterium]
MDIKEITRILEADIVYGEALNREITKVAAADLMSDVLSFSKEGALLLTGLTNSQVIRTAEMSDIGVICFVRGKKPQKNMLELGKERGIPLLATKLSMYEACGRLYQKGLQGCECN